MTSQNQDPPRRASKEALREAFRKEREAAGLEGLHDDPECDYEGLGYEEACALFSERIRARLQFDPDVDALEYKAFLAFVEDRPQEFARLLELKRRRTALGLVVIKGGNASNQ
jgi:hypothetical protein